MSGVDVLARIDPSPKEVAGMFWRLGDQQQADFFAELDSLAGVMLCFQMSAVIDVIQQRAYAGDHAAMNGLQTMLSHAQNYATSATDYRAWEAKRAIAKLVQDPQA